MQLFKEHKAEYQALMRPGLLETGIQIHVDDSTMQEDAGHLQSFLHNLACALQIEVGPMNALTWCRGAI